jgi:tetratricopeptide (TPR) repeat protein
VAAAAVCLLLLGAAAPASAEPSPTSACRRDEGSLTRYLLCLELQVRRAPETHRIYYAELEEIETTVLRRLPHGKWKGRRNILPSLYHANRPETAYLPQLTLADALDWRRGDDFRRLAADCDVFSLINAGIAERHYGEEYPLHRVVLVRTRHDHVVNALTRESKLAGVLETEDGSFYRGNPVTREEHRFFRPMTEREVVALYLAHVGLALMREGRDVPALGYIDESLRLNAAEFVAHAGQALTLLLAVASQPGSPGDEATPWCAGPEAAIMLERAELAAREAMRLEPTADSPYSLLGKIKLHQCRAEQARDYLERAVDLRPDPLDFYYLGLILHEQGKSSEAIRLVRRGRKAIRAGRDPRYRTLQVEMEFLLAHAHTRRAGLNGSPRELRRAMRFLEAVQREFPDHPNVQGLHRVIQRLDYKIGPVRRHLGIPQSLGRALYNASLDE